MLNYRLISICILAPIVITILLLSTIIQLSIFTLIICLIGAWEWSKIMKFSTYMHQFWMYIIFGLLCIIMEINVFQYYLHFNFWNIFKYIYSVITLWWIIAFLLILFYPYSVIVWKNSNILRFCFGILIILPFFWGILTLRQFYCITTNNFVGEWWLLYIMVLVWINDSSAYIFGRILGKYKLFKVVSPNKTWEGLIGGILISTGFAWLFNQYIPIIVIVKPLIVFIYSIIAIFSAVIGDVFESMFKREAKVKDSGKLIPGHGGILDRIDSLTAAIPIFTCLMLLTYSDDIIFLNKIF